MARFELVMPKMGESIIEATIIRWVKNVGDTIEEEDVIVEIATDKVDSEIPSPVDGKLSEVLYKEGDVVPVGQVIAVISMDEESEIAGQAVSESGVPQQEAPVEPAAEIIKPAEEKSSFTRFYSPLVRSISRQENIPAEELEKIPGSGKDGRLTRDDLLRYISRRSLPAAKETPVTAILPKPIVSEGPKVLASPGDELVEMDRMRRLIADHMVMSKKTSPHVTSFIEVDMSRVVRWRDKVKDEFLRREKEKLTYMPIIVEAAARALKDFPGVNASVDGYTIILKKNINIGMATALPNGNLIVPVIKNADQKNLLGLAKTVNDLANRARNNKLDPDDIQGGTFTITNLGTFASLTGAPVINQPQVAILGIGVIKKKPVVIETEEGDMIGIRSICILSLAYDHRAVDGALGGMYLQRVAEYLENYDMNRTV
ncbi:MAG TPA: dihydrolipoamide acetyltransferase family protein [Bacteroidales bacterium]|nr:dihydrolipoamide acetyltransferase family protein [Bacteroidales bacterium]HNS46025.1 dihydrolipoamide acetyltransferase family protein [Bacteroidales bacterium]